MSADDYERYNDDGCPICRRMERAIAETHRLQPQDVDDYWASEPIENEAVAEWFGQQPEADAEGVAR